MHSYFYSFIFSFVLLVLLRDELLQLRDSYRLQQQTPEDCLNGTKHAQHMLAEHNKLVIRREQQLDHFRSEASKLNTWNPSGTSKAERANITKTYRKLQSELNST